MSISSNNNIFAAPTMKLQNKLIILVTLMSFYQFVRSVQSTVDFQIIKIYYYRKLNLAKQYDLNLERLNQMVQIFEWIKGADDEAAGTDLALLIY